MSTKRQLNPGKLLHSKWTAAHPIDRQRHFIVTKVYEPEPPDQAISLIDLQAVLTHRTQTLQWRELLDTDRWIQGWQ